MLTGLGSEKKYYVIGSIFVFLISVTVLTAFTGSLFQVFNSFTLIVYSCIAVWEIFYEKTLPPGLTKVILLSVAYYFLIMLVNDNAGAGSTVLIVSSLLSMIVMNRLAIKRKLLVYLEYFSMLAVFGMTAVSFYIHGSIANYVAFTNRGVNPNSWAEITIFLAMLFTALHVERGRLAGLFIILCSCLTAYNCRTRFMTVGALLFAVFYLFPLKAFKNNRMKMLSFAVILAGTLFPFLYLMIYRSGFQMMIYGKDIFSGREVIWSTVFAEIGKDPLKLLFGLGSNFSAEITNVHSVYVGVIADFGIVGYFIYFSFILYAISLKGSDIKCENTKNALLMFIAGNLFMGITETSMLWSGVFCLSYIGLGIADPINYNVRRSKRKISRQSLFRVNIRWRRI